MAAMYQQGPLQAYSRPGSAYCRPYRSAINAKRKSAVELLEETKSLYVKSGNVLDAKQDLKAQQFIFEQHLQQHEQREKESRTTSYANVSPVEQIHHHHQILTPPAPTHSHHHPCVVPQRRSNNSAGSSDQLQTKLRRLLNADSKENLADIENIDTSNKEALEGNESNGQKSTNRTNCRSLPDLTAPFSKQTFAVYTPSSSKKHSSESSSKHEEMSISKSANTDDTDSDSSSDKSYGQPPSPTKSSLSFGGSATKAEIRRKRTVVEWEGVEVIGRLSRSKSEMGPGSMLSSSSSPLHSILSSPPAVAKSVPAVENLPQHLNDFFQYLGLTSAQYSALTDDCCTSGTVESSTCSSPVFFSSSSSIESSLGRSRRAGSSPITANCGGSQGATASPQPPQPGVPSPLPSIVERNARVIKWLCHCTRTSNLPSSSTNNEDP